MHMQLQRESFRKRVNYMYLIYVNSIIIIIITQTDRIPISR